MRQLGQITLMAVAAGCVAILILARPTGAGQDPAVTLQRAIQLETVDGNLNAAIEHYKQVIKSNGGNRSVAAQALLRLGGCYEKLGQEEALKTYQQLVNDYADQQQEVKLARQRLAALTKGTEAAASAPKFRRMEIPGKPPHRSGAMLSPDGTRFAFVAEGGIWTVPVSGNVDPDIAGQPIRLTKDMGAWDNGNIGFTWSVDGQWIAFRGRPEDSVYLVPASGGEPRRVDGIGKIAAGAQSFRVSVSREAKRIVFAQYKSEKDLAPYLFTIPGGGGDPTQLVAEQAIEPAFSPNGKLIAYRKLGPLRPGSPRVTQIMVVSADGGEPAVVSSGAGFYTGPIWSPGGDMIAFGVSTNDVPEKLEIWIVPVSTDGRPEAEPTKIDLEQIAAAMLRGKRACKFLNPLGGWSLKNEIALLLESPLDEAIYTVPVSGGRATRVALSGREPRWSPDGRRIYFRGKTNVESVAASGGDERSVPIRGESRVIVGFPAGSNEVSRDGNSIVFYGGYRASKDVSVAGVFTVPSEGGDVRPIAVSNNGAERNPCWSPDGKWIAFTKRRSGWAASDVAADIWIIPFNGGSPKRLTADADQAAAAELRWSPDGKTIAYFGADKTVRLIPAAGGSSRVLTKIPSVNHHLGLSWSPDSSKLAYTTIQKAWIIPSSGGEPQEIRVGFDGRIMQIDWSPDGKTFAFSGGTGGEEEVWLMSDFLHLLKTGR
jgi:Tol biopolymer transport system component